MDWEYFDFDHFDLDRIVDTLYDLENWRSGGLVVPGFLRRDARHRIMGEISRAEDGFTRNAQRYGVALQELSSFHLGESDKTRVDGVFPHILELRDRYQQVYELVGQKAGFGNPCLDSIAVNKYEKGALGITAHRDRARYVNLISVFVIRGQGDFCVYPDIKGSKGVLLGAGPGDLILMRAPRNRGENRYRPYHSIGSISQERYSIGLRQHRGESAE